MIQAAQEVFGQIQTQPGLKTTNTLLIQLVKLVLTRSKFQFNNQHYLQIKGCAMGTRVAASFAYTYIGKFEDEHVYTYHLQLFLYLRYLDHGNMA